MGNVLCEYFKSQRGNTNHARFYLRHANTIKFQQLCIDKSCNGVNFEFQYDDLPLYLKLLVLLYADDTVVFGTDEKEFQNNSDMIYEFSELWHLSINFD